MKLIKEQCYIDGKWVGKKSIPVHNPSTGALIGEIPNMGAEETKSAVQAASKAFPSWAARTPKERSLLIRRWYELIMENLDDLATIMTMEQGKPFPEAQGEIRYAASFPEWFAEEAKRVYGEIISSPVPKQNLFAFYQPIGVVGAITPWNFPSSTVTRKCAPALAAGCTMVLKPSEFTPFSAFALAALAEQAGIPPGVFNVITGDAPAIGNALTGSPDVHKISFTGSTKVGKLLYAACANTVKKISLELGGSAPFIVFADANIDDAVQGLIDSRFRNSGQGCTSADRVFVEASIYDTFTKKLVQATSQLKVADGFEAGAKQGPLINEAAVAKVERHIADALSKGAKIACGGKRHPLGRTFFEPTILTHVTADMQVAQEETFGPVAPLLQFHTEEEAIQMANDTSYGLASYFYSQNVDRIFRVSKKIQAGMVCVNTGLLHSEAIPFGGIKESGLGREGSHYGIEEFLVLKSICLANKE
jgi:succinate-semialdehyde dehydrogenase/glutarate-semialdehyde dehydrogenase